MGKMSADELILSYHEDCLILQKYFGGGGGRNLTVVKQGFCFYDNLSVMVFGLLVQFFINDKTRGSLLPLSLTMSPLCLKKFADHTEPRL